MLASFPGSPLSLGMRLVFNNKFRLWNDCMLLVVHPHRGNEVNRTMEVAGLDRLEAGRLGFTKYVQLMM